MQNFECTKSVTIKFTKISVSLMKLNLRYIVIVLCERSKIIDIVIILVNRI